MPPNREQRAALGGGAAGLALGAALGVSLRSKAAAAANNNGNGGSVTPEWAENDQALIDAMNNLADALTNQLGNPQTGIFNPAVPNRPGVVSVRITVEDLNDLVQFPSILIPDSFELKIKAGYANGGQVYIATNGNNAANVDSAEELVRGEFTLYKIQQADVLWFFGNKIGDYITLTVEQ